MVSRFRAFAVAVLWVVTGTAAVLVALILTSQGIGDDGLVSTVTGAFRDYLRWWLVLVGGCLLVATLWIGPAARTARSSASLGAQGALIGMATAMIGLLLLLILGQAF